MCNYNTKNKISQCFQDNLRLKPIITKLKWVICEFCKMTEFSLVRKLKILKNWL